MLIGEYAVQVLSPRRWLSGDTLQAALDLLEDEPGSQVVAIRVHGRVVGTTTLDHAREALARAITVHGSIMEETQTAGLE